MDASHVAWIDPVGAAGCRGAERRAFTHGPRGAPWISIWLVLTASCASARHPAAAPEPSAGPASGATDSSATKPTAVDGEAPKPSLDKTYTDKERVQLTYCIGLSETARRAAAEKLRGSRIEDVKKWYEGKPNARLNIATVDKVFGEQVSTAWDYAVGFFGECAREMAGVSSERVELASYCMQNQLMADVAYQLKASGRPKEQAYGQFARFKSATPKSIVDLVYASSKERAAVRMEVWNTCMAELSGG